MMRTLINADCIEHNTIYNENCINTMNRMNDESVHLVVTSPPYDELRTYDNTLRWGEDVWNDVISGLYRVVVSGGVVVWVVGDMVINRGKSGTSFKQALCFLDAGFIMHDTMIYQKSGVPVPGNRRYHPTFEYMFIFSKGPPTTFHPIADRVNKHHPQTASSQRQPDGTLIKKSHERRYKRLGIRTNIWKYGGGFSSRAHPATFPDRLAYDHILSWSNQDDVVYDPFMGSGTTAVAALSAKRVFIGSEVNSTYFRDAQRRVELWPNSFTGRKRCAPPTDDQLSLFK